MNACRLCRLLIVLLLFSSHTFAQKSTPLPDALKKVTKAFGTQFVYDKKLVDGKTTTYNLDDISNKPVEEVLKALLYSNNLVFLYIRPNYYSIVPKDRVGAENSAPDQKPAVAQSEKIRITGTVTDNNGKVIPDATITEKGTTNSASSNNDGSFAINVSSTRAVLSVSSVGYETNDIVVGTQTNLIASLATKTAAMEEVVVIGYGVQKKKLVTGATSQVKGADIQKRNMPAVLDALKGQVAGLTITKVSAQPGDGFKVNIRGIGTTGNAEPLYVVDGVPVPNINNLNPADVESLDILKDAASAAIYGARASNGVILITTKKGRVGKPSITYDGYYGIQNVAKKVEYLGAKDYLVLMAEHYKNNNIAVPNFSALIPGYAGIADGTWDGTNWLDATSNKNAPIQSHSVNISGGTEQAIYSMGIGSDAQEGIVGKPAVPTYKRLSFRMNSEYTLLKRNNLDVLKVGENFTYGNIGRHVTILEGAGNETSYASVASGSPVIQIYNPDPTKQGPYPYFPYNVYGSPTGVAPTAPNPMAWLDYAKKGNFSRTNNLNGNLYLTLQPSKGLVFRSSFGIYSFSLSNRSFVPAYLLSATATTSYFVNNLDRTSQSIQMGTKWIFDNTVNYKFTLKDKHNFDVMIGGSAEKSGIGESISGENANSLFDNFDYAYLTNNRTIDPAFTRLSGQPLVPSRILSGFSRVSYDLNQTYMLTAVFRADGSSNFAPGNRWGFFPSLSAGWVLSNEKFMASTSSWLNVFKLRASWGENGNQSISPFQYLSTISFNGAPFFRYADRTRFDNGGYPNILPNPDVTWETSVQTDIGVDARFLRNKLGLTFDWYNKQTKDWLLRAPVMATNGTGAPFINGGDVENRGYEVALTWNDRIGKLNYGISANFAQQKNTVISIANQEGIIHGPNGTLHADQKEVYRAQVGMPIGYFWGLKSNGIFQNAQEVSAYKNKAGNIIQPSAQPGDMRYVDQNGDGVINQDDYIKLGDPNPDYIFGFSFNCSYKGFDLSAVTNGVAGNQVIWNYFNNNNHGTYNWSTLALDRWHGEGTSNTFPRVNIGSTQDITLSDRFVSDAGFLRLTNLTLGYDLKARWRNIPLQQLRLYFSGQNLFTITPYKGFNPEVGSGGNNGGNWAGGVDSSPYPVARTFMLGAAIRF
jgi:TonB-dependent starch-binding outer membrane protein SusC